MNSSHSHLNSLIQQGQMWSGDNPSLQKRLVLPFGCIEIDRSLPETGLACGSIHEWVVPKTASGHTPSCSPLAVICSLLGRSKDCLSFGKFSFIAWVGRNCWPSNFFLQKAFQDSPITWQRRTLFLHPENARQNTLCALQTLRSPSTAAVVFAANNASFLDTKRLQLAARQHNAIGFLLRDRPTSLPPTAAETRWLIEPAISTTRSLCWKLSLLKAKGLSEPLHWDLMLEEDSLYGTRSLALSAKPCRGSIAAQTPAAESQNKHQHRAA